MAERHKWYIIPVSYTHLDVYKRQEMSGGQKQLLNLASIMVMRPEVLLLDEPTAQLDPLAKKKFIDTVLELNKDFGITIMCVEHNLADIYSKADKMCIRDRINPRDVGEKQLCQVLCAYRLFLPFVGITVSSRESASFRNGITKICATKVSAGVSTCLLYTSRRL